MRLLAAALAAAALAAAAEEIPPDLARALQPYHEFRTHALASWHPARREVLVLHGTDGAQAAHRVTDPGAALQTLTASAGASQAAWQPVRGDHFVFIAPGPDGVPRVQRYDASTQSAAMVSPPGERATGFTWNPAGDRIAYATMPRDGPVRTVLRLVDPARPATERLLARLEGTWTDLRFGANGRRLAAVQVLSGDAGHLWQIDVATGTRRRVTRPDPKAPAAYRSPQFSPDGNSLFALAARGSEPRRLVLVPMAGGAERVLSGHLAHDVDAFAVSSDAGLAAFLTNENGAHVMRFIDLATLKEQPRPPLFGGVIGGLAWRPGSREIGFHIASARTAGDVFSYDARTNQLTRWTNGNGPRVNTREFAEPGVIRWKVEDGRELTALHYAPPARFTGRRPVIVDHRSARPGAGFLGPANYLLGELGIAIVRPRAPAGSNAIPALLEWIARRPDMDAARTVVIGDAGASEMDDEAFLRAALDFARRVKS